MKPPQLSPGEILEPYRLVEKIGEGGMGIVWKAVDTKLEREVAIKILPEAFSEDPDRLGRFKREARLLASLNHANVAAVHGFHEIRGLSFLAMEFIPGEDLAKPTGVALDPDGNVYVSGQSSNNVFKIDKLASDPMRALDACFMAVFASWCIRTEIIGEVGDGPKLAHIHAELMR